MSTDADRPGDAAARAKDLFGEALERAPEERAAFVAERAGADAMLRARVDALLAAHAHAEDVLGPERTTPWAPGARALLLPHEGDLRAGDVLGPYRILGTAGSGGFGTVYLAEQTVPVTRRVALKVMRHGLDSDAARARFDAERQALARMEHPAIARVFDAGTTQDGRPYFAMEFVPGLPITEYCERRALPLEERLAIFRVVCQAVQHAHHKGVVHRDLKPTNVLVAEVDGAPLPKVIDFGVAKAIDRPLTDLAQVSVDGQLVGTPAYMSPEQAAGEVDVDTRSDVYGLGALLYELIAGSPPFDARELGFAALLDAITRTEPERPSRRSPRGSSATRGRIPDDLDWIAMRCLEKERARRYPSANALALDVERFLAGRPVEAAPPSTWYRLRKLTSRHRLAVAGAAALVVVFAAGSAGTLVGLVRARHANQELGAALRQVNEEAERARLAEHAASVEAENARRQAAVARAVNDFLTQDLLAAALPSAEDGRGRDVPLRVVVDAASHGIEGAGEPGGRFADAPEVESSIRFMLGSVYSKLGEIDAALPHLRRALEIDERELGPEHENTLRSRSTLANQLRRKGALDEAEALLVPALEAQRRLLGPDDPSTLLSEWYLGLLRYRQSRTQEAYDLLREARERSAAALGAQHGITLWLLGALAMAAQDLGHDEEAEAALREMLAGCRATLGPDHADTVSAMANLAASLRGMGRTDEAAALLEEARTRFSALLGPEHPATLAALYNLGAIAIERGRGAEAEALLREAYAGFQKAYGPVHQDTLRAESALARSLELVDRREEAEALHRRALAESIAALGPDHPVTNARRQMLSGFLFQDPERIDEVLELLHAALESQRRTAGPTHPATLRATANLAQFHLKHHQLDQAEPLFREALAGLRERVGPDHVAVADVESDLSGVLVDTGRAEEGEALARHSVEVAERRLPADAYDLARYRLRLGLALRALGRGDEGRALFETAHATLVATRGDADPMTAYAAGELAEWDAPQPR